MTEQLMWSSADTPAAPSATVEISGVTVVRTTGDDVLRRLREFLADTGRHYRLAYVNAHSINVSRRNENYRSALARTDLILNDGVGLDIAARLRGTKFPENLNGTDFTPRVLAIAAEMSLRVFLLGGRDGVAEQAAVRLTAALPDLDIVGTRSGEWADSDEDSVVEEIRRTGADVLVVGLGNPLQEIWLDKHLETTGCRLGLSVGAFFDFTSGHVPRAPQLVRRLRLEWIYRLAREPRRLASRYIIGVPDFLISELRDVRSNHPNSAQTYLEDDMTEIDIPRQDPRYRNEIFDTTTIGTYLRDYVSHIEVAANSVDSDALERAQAVLEQAAADGRRVYVVGNGGSAAISEHLCCDMTKGTHRVGHPTIDAQSLTSNVALYSAIANDFGFEQVFAAQLRMVGRPGDVLIAISSSGESPNIVNAVESANELGMLTIGLSGFTGGKVRKMSDIAVHVDADNYGIVEDVHQMLVHVLAQHIAAPRDAVR